MFLHLSVILSTAGGMSASVHDGIHPLPWQKPPRQTPPWADTPLRRHPREVIHLRRHPLGKHPPAQYMLGYTVSSACWDKHGYCCGRYTSYWNAFLFMTKSWGIVSCRITSCQSSATIYSRCILR